MVLLIKAAVLYILINLKEVDRMCSRQTKIHSLPSVITFKKIQIHSNMADKTRIILQAKVFVCIL